MQRQERLLLSSKHKSDTVHGIRIKGFGNIEGRASISLILNGKPYRTEALSGEVDFYWSGDWYSDTAEILYQPADVASGTVTLRYEFLSL